MARALIRHNVGNRDQLIDVFVADFVARSKAETETMIAGLPQSGRATQLVYWLFDPDYVDAEGAAIGNALLAAVDQHPNLASAMADWNNDFVRALAAVFEAETGADAGSSRQVAVGVSALYANVEALAAIDEDDRIRTDSLQSALRLLATLGPVNGSG